MFEQGVISSHWQPYLLGMSNEAAMTRLEEAMEKIEAAREEAERDIAKQELSNLRTMALDCVAGLETDIQNQTSHFQ